MQAVNLHLTFVTASVSVCINTSLNITIKVVLIIHIEDVDALL